jgi:hypothetical protein
MSKKPCTCMEDIEDQLDEMCIAFKAHMIANTHAIEDVAKFLALGVRLQSYAIALTTRHGTAPRESLLGILAADYRATVERSILSFETIAAEYELEQGAPKQ